MLNPVDYGLTENPFSILPNAEIEHWAGLPKTKEALSDVITSVRPDDVGASEFVVMNGSYGAGKSHALRYFTHAINKEKFGCAIYMNEVMVGSGLSFSALCPRILQQLQDETINNLIGNVKDSLNRCVEEMNKDSSYEIDTNIAIKNKISIQQDRELVKSIHDNGVIPSIEGKDDFTAVKMLASLFRIMTSPIGDNPPPFGAIYLFLDEAESILLQAKAAQQIAFFSSLRSLINDLTEHFALILSFSESTGVLEAAVPQALQERMTRPYIQCEQLTSDGAKKFVKDYLGFVRPEKGFSPPQPFYPFSEEAINTIFEREPTLLPRKILMHLRRVWERAARYENLKLGDEISQDMADEILDGVI